MHGGAQHSTAHLWRGSRRRSRRGAAGQWPASWPPLHGGRGGSGPCTAAHAQQHQVSNRSRCCGSCAGASAALRARRLRALSCVPCTSSACPAASGKPGAADRAWRGHVEADACMGPTPAPAAPGGSISQRSQPQPGWPARRGALWYQSPMNTLKSPEYSYPLPAPSLGRTTRAPCTRQIRASPYTGPRAGWLPGPGTREAAPLPAAVGSQHGGQAAGPPEVSQPTCRPSALWKWLWSCLHAAGSGLGAYVGTACAWAGQRTTGSFPRPR